MADSESVQKLLFEEVRFFFEPLLQTDGDPDKVILCFETLGMNLNALFDGTRPASFFSGIQTIIQSASLLDNIVSDPPDTLGEISDALVRVNQLASALRNLSHGLPPAVQGFNAFTEELMKRLFTVYIRERSDIAYTVFRLLNIIAFDEPTAAVVQNGRLIVDCEVMPVFRTDKLQAYLQDPINAFQNERLQPGFADLQHVNEVAAILFHRLQVLLNVLGFDVAVGNRVDYPNLSATENERLKGMLTASISLPDDASGATLTAGITLGMIPVNEGGPGLFGVPFGMLAISHQFETWRLHTQVSGQSEGFEITESGVDLYGVGITSWEFDVGLFHSGEAPWIFGDAAGTRLEINKLGFAAGLHLRPSEREIFFKAILEECRLVISAGEGDGFLQHLLSGNPIEAKFGLTAGVSNLHGLFFDGGSGLEVLIPLHLECGPFEITNVLAAVNLSGLEIPLELSTTIRANLGPLVAVVENIGVRITASFPDDGSGNLGPVELQVGLKPPNGVGLNLDTGIITGGGYLYIDVEKGEYAGALQLSVQNFLSLTAIGLINTKMPNGENGFSLLVIVTAQFMPPFQLGYGFTLSGVGGLLGLNREVLLEPLRDGVRTGAINGIMFPTDVIANAPRIISDLQAIFPVKEGYFLIGPMAKIGWGTPTLISLSLGLIIQLPDPKIAILGVLKTILPTEETGVLKLQVNFLGTIDPANQLITFDASLYDSNLLEIFTLTGDMAVRLRWGARPDFILAAGGFHPEYEPTMAMPSLQRIGFKILDLDNARIQLQSYFAVTSNTAQLGARADCFFGLDGFSVSGSVGFDALMQFSPFRFQAVAYGAFTLETAIGEASIRICASLVGPSPWQVRATGSVEVFGFEFEAEFEQEWGPRRQEVRPRIAIRPLILGQFDKPDAWTAEKDTSRTPLIQISTVEDQGLGGSGFFLYPDQTLTLRQKLLPLKCRLQKVGNQEISDVHEVSIVSVKVGNVEMTLSNVTDTFAIGQYTELSDEEKLSRPSFEFLNCGVEASFLADGQPFKMGATVRRTQVYEQVILDREKVKSARGFKTKRFGEMLKGAAASKSKLSQSRRHDLGKPKTKQPAPLPEFRVVDVQTHQDIDSNLVLRSHLDAVQHLQSLCAGNQALVPNLTILEP